MMMLFISVPTRPVKPFGDESTKGQQPDDEGDPDEDEDEDEDGEKQEGF